MARHARSGLRLAVRLALVVTIILLLAILPAQSGSSSADKQYLEENGKKPGVITTATGVQYKILRNHTRASIKWEFPPKFEAGGTLVRAGDELIVSYTATTIDGAEIESSYKHGNSTVRIKQNEVLRGLEEVLLLMRVGDESF